ncbi:hypothetical protein PV350_17165 [Streptomyces sp. PA03-6a]|nr:hypothetical protein [Streptomyces sp. PA03-6a]
MSHVQETEAGARRGGPRKRGPADPVRALMHRHRQLCAEAVDPLEIVAGLEAQGVTDRVAAGFRHRDVFSLAEELYARVPRATAPPAADAAELTALALSLAPAAWCAHRFAVRSRGHMLRSRSLEEFGGAVRPLLAGTLALFLAFVLVLLCAARAVAGAPLTPAALAGPAALALLLFTARLLAVHGHPDPAAIGTGLACATEAVALAAALLNRSPLPPSAVPVLACAAAALALAAHALTTLSRASAHTAAAAPR